MSDNVRRLNQRLEALRLERSSWDSHWRDISRVLFPRGGRFTLTDRNRGERRNGDIIDPSATFALRVLVAGIYGNMTNPAVPWLQLTLEDPELAKWQPVKVWLNEVSLLVLRVLHKSNAYRALQMMYQELGSFGTSASLIGDHYQNLIHVHPFTVGEYFIATDFDGVVNTLYREFEKPVHAVVSEFGLDACSDRVKNMYTTNKLDAWVPIRHAIEPRMERDVRKKDARNMAFRSVYWEASESTKVLRESGYQQFPIVAPRWIVTGGDIYGMSPAMDALGSIEELQLKKLRENQAIDYQANPPIQIPTSMKSREAELFPGGISYYDPVSGPNGGIRTAFEVNLDIRNLLLSTQDVRGLIDKAFFVDLFTMHSQNDRDMTAYEVARRNEERMVVLGPVVERLNNELLDPLIEMVFQKIVAAGVLPTPPEEVNGKALNVEYTSALAMAQKAIVANSTDRFVGALTTMAQLKPGALDKFDEDAWADAYADQLGVDPSLIVAGEKLALIRQQRAQQQQAVQQAEMLNQMSQTARNLGQTNLTNDSAAGRMMRGMNNGR